MSNNELNTNIEITFSFDENSFQKLNIDAIDNLNGIEYLLVHERNEQIQKKDLIIYQVLLSQFVEKKQNNLFKVNISAINKSFIILKFQFLKPTEKEFGNNTKIFLELLNNCNIINDFEILLDRSNEQIVVDTQTKLETHVLNLTKQIENLENKMTTLFRLLYFPIYSDSEEKIFDLLSENHMIIQIFLFFKIEKFILKKIKNFE